VIQKALSKELIDEVISLSRDMRRKSESRQALIEQGKPLADREYSYQDQEIRSVSGP
jgi:hypothetical protein